MLTFSLRVWPVLAFLFSAGLANVGAQTNSAATNTPSTNAPTATAPTAIAVGEIVSQAQADTTKLQADQADLSADQTLQTASDKLASLTSDINDRTTEDTQQLGSNPTLNRLQTSKAAWESLSDELDSTQKDLSQRVQQLDNLSWQLAQMDNTWKATLDAATKTNAPAEILKRIRDVRALVATTAKAVQSSLVPLYTMQNRVAAQDARTRSALDTVGKQIDNARNALFKQDHPRLWNPASLSSSGASVVSQEKFSLDEQLLSLKHYLKEKIGAVLVHLFLLAVLVMAFYWIRNTIHVRAKEEPELQIATQVFSEPLATALLLTLLATGLFYAEAPRLLWAIAGATALIPAVIIIRRLIDPANFSLLYATVIAYLVDQVRYVVTQDGVPLRLLFVLELSAVSLFMLWALSSKRLANSLIEANRLKRFTRIYLHLAFLVFIFAGFANVFGYIHLSTLVGDAMLESSYLAVILYAAVRIVDALSICALHSQPLSSLGMVRRHRDLLQNNTSAATRWLFFGLWFLLTLQLFTLRDPAWQAVNQVLWKEYKWFSIPFSLGAILAFPITVWAAFLISRFVRFTLEEEIYPHLQLGRGIPYAASTMVNYCILLLGFFIAVEATGAQLNQFAFLAGAFGVGLGFGMQNIMNNFVSGIILLFERPIKVGDTIQIDAATIGTVERIGIRASVVLLTNGSELIVPNGNLISNPVTNWTLSNCERVIEIPVTVTSKPDPKHVMELLTKVARAHHSVIKNPAPEALLAAPGGATMAFKLRVWIDSEEEWMEVTSDLSLAINEALAKENITQA